MAAGITIVRTSFDQDLGNKANGIDQLLLQWHQLYVWLTGPGGGFSGIQASPLSYTDTPSGQGDATHVFGAISDMEQLYQIYIGAQTLGSLKNFKTANLDKLYGTGVH